MHCVKLVIGVHGCKTIVIILEELLELMKVGLKQLLSLDVVTLFQILTEDNFNK